jgi:CheY-like chemotaxis protein
MNKKSIWLIDDDEDVREVISFALGHEGYQIKEMTNASDALTLLLELKAEDLPSLIIVDYLMPEMDGVSFIKKLRFECKDQLGSIPLILCTAKETFNEFEDVMTGVTELHKPMDLNDLLEVVNSHCC